MSLKTWDVNIIIFDARIIFLIEQIAADIYDMIS